MEERGHFYVEETPKRAVLGAKLGVVIALLCFTAGYTVTQFTASSMDQEDSELAEQAQTVTRIRASFLEDDISELPQSVADHVDSMESHDAPTNDALRVNTESLSMTVSNLYTKVIPIETGQYRYPWSYLAEPYRVTNLAVENPYADGWYKWTVDGHVQGYGSGCDVLFTDVGYHSVILMEKTDTKTSYLSTKVMVKYTRREIRSLSDIDREKFFDAAHILSRVPTEIGQRMFGIEYKSKDYFNRVHLYYGGTADCDHWHQGAGFVTSHVTFTLEYERAIQSVFPDVTVPYWDFTLESTFYRADDWRSSPIFSSSWFGEASPDNDLHTVTDGRWAYESAMSNAWNFSKIVNSYGVLRAPWNNDPTPFMTRHDHIYGDRKSVV